MNQTATLKRAVVVSSGCLMLLALSACAARSGSSLSSSLTISAESGPGQDAVIGAAQTASVEAAVGAAGGGDIASSSRILMNPKQEALGLELIDGPGFNRLLIQTPANVAANYEVNRLTSPSRLVVDLLGQESKSSHSFDTSDAELISKIRIGAHPEKSRIVLDLVEGEDIEYRVDNLQGLGATEQNGVVITLARAGRLNQALHLEPSSAMASQAERESPETPGTFEPFTSEAVAEESMPSMAESRAKLASLEMQPVGSSENMVVAQLTSLQPYTLKKTAPSEYVLTIENTDLEETGVGTLLAPPGAGAIRSVRPVREGSNLLLRIFAAPETNLAARSSASGKIVITASSPAEEALRAQMASEDGQAEPAKSETAARNPGADVTVKEGTSEAADQEIGALFEEQPKYSGRLISLDLQDTDIDNALRIIAEVSNLNIIASQDVTGKVTLRLIDVPWDQALDVILKTNGLDKVQEGNVIRIAPIEKLRQERENIKNLWEAEQAMEPLQVRYIRISYAKAADLKPLVESVLSERGSVTYDERTNQIIVKDIRSGIKNVAELVSKIDLRTPQVLLETQIVEASRSLLRDLGAELGFAFIQSPATGNATGMNFPNSIAVGGSVAGASGTASSFPAAGSAAAGSAVSLLLESADATKSLTARISALETEGRVRIISRPSVATTNNKQATIKSIEKIRIKTPSGGLSVATGQGASASGSSAVATEAVEIGIILEVTPQASPDYFVLLDINAKSSTLGSHTVDGIPSEVERSATSSVLVSSGQTFAMGGIYKISDNDNISGVPFLKDIPVLGFLFRNQKINNADEELLFFLTPRIIEGSFDDAAMKATT